MTSATTIILMFYFIQGSMGHVLTQSESPTVGMGIEGSHPVDIEVAPFLAALFYVDDYGGKIEFWCRGSIIHKQFVLTSAICSKFSRYPTNVRVGSSHFNEGGKVHQVEKYIVHEAFSWYPLLNNVALLKLTEPVTLGPSVNIVKLADDSVNITAGLTSNVTGWVNRNHMKMPQEFEQVTVTVLPLEDCYKSYSRTTLTDKQMCVRNERNAACIKDGGGPLLAGDLLIGFVSNGVTCMDQPSVYEKVAPHLQWIHDQIKQNL